ncbi:MAG: tetratricopeptide repeat protein [Gammaproteobacteria bacterium]|nr:tetratricopeptide repeat protein [Gammaproteobacteria bacterium]
MNTRNVSDKQLRTFHINDWHVDVAANRLCLGQTEIKIEAKAMEVLAYLANRPGEIITRQELEHDVWAGKVVGYDSLTRIITKLRKALNDDSRDPHYIETISKKGYRLIASVNREMSATQHRPRGVARWIVPSMAIAIALLLIVFILEQVLERNTPVIAQNVDNTSNNSTDLNVVQDNTPSIAVLPFGDLSDHATHSYLSEGITEDITTALSKLSGLFVIDRSSTLKYKNQTIDVKYAAKQLNVRYLLDGSVRQSGSKLRVNAKLIDGSSGVLLWGEYYDREMKDIFSVQDDITMNIVSALSVKLTEEEKRRAAHPYTLNIDAYDEFLRGQVLYAHHTREDNLWARESYLKSIDMDPNFARAYSALALTYSAEFRYNWHAAPDESLRQAAKLAQKAVSIDNQLPNAFWVLGYVYLHQQKYKQAIEAANRAIALNPNNADSYATLGLSYVYDGEPEKGTQMLRRAMRLNPQYPAAYASALGQAYYFQRKYADALPALQDAVERNINLRSSHVYLIASLSQMDKNDEASWAAIQLRTLDPDFSVDNISDMFPIKNEEWTQEIKLHLRRAGLQ